jgi:lysophosphatidate acyltransferase
MPNYLEILILYIPSGLVVLTMGLYLASYPLPFLAFYARLVASYLSLIACALYGVAASIFLRLIGYGRVSQWATARSFKWVMRYTTGMRFEIEEEGKHWLHERPVVFVGNHQT